MVSTLGFDICLKLLDTAFNNYEKFILQNNTRLCQKTFVSDTFVILQSRNVTMCWMWMMCFSQVLKSLSAPFKWCSNINNRLKTNEKWVHIYIGAIFAHSLGHALLRGIGNTYSPQRATPEGGEDTPLPLFLSLSIIPPQLFPWWLSWTQNHCTHIKGTRCLGLVKLKPFVMKIIWLERCFKSRI